MMIHHQSVTHRPSVRWDEVARIEANFRNTGSDHFPIGGASGL
jgi:hypothetical protein